MFRIMFTTSLLFILTVDQIDRLKAHEGSLAVRGRERILVFRGKRLKTTVAFDAFHT